MEIFGSDARVGVQVASTSPVVADQALLITPVYEADQSPLLVYLARLSVSSRRPQRSALESIARILTSQTLGADDLPWHLLRYQHSQAVRAAVAERFAPSTANRSLAALRGVLKECWRLGLMDSETFHRAADVEVIRGSRAPRGRALSGGEVRALFEACAKDRSAAGARDSALLATLYGGGLRRAEAADLDLADYDRETGSLTVRRGKGNKSRTGFATNGAAGALDAWIELRGDEPGPLLRPVNKGGRVIPTGMTASSIYAVLGKRAREAGVSRLSPHDLRRTFVSDLLDLGADVSLVAGLAGHSSVTTTARYDRRPEAARKRAAELLHVPYVARVA